MVEDGDAGEHQAEQQEIDRDRADGRRLGEGRPGGSGTSATAQASAADGRRAGRGGTGSIAPNRDRFGPGGLYRGEIRPPRVLWGGERTARPDPCLCATRWLAVLGETLRPDAP
jgi:hypothetical protein